MCRTFSSSSSELDSMCSGTAWFILRRDCPGATGAGVLALMDALFGSSVLDPQAGSNAEESNLK